jgi:quercetin dioxygenase-like cupin family protein
MLPPPIFRTNDRKALGPAQGGAAGNRSKERRLTLAAISGRTGAGGDAPLSKENPMRLILTGAFLLASAVAAGAQTPPPAAAPLQQYDVPTAKPQTVAILTRDFAPGQSAGRHIHHGVEMTVVIRGDLELDVDGQPAHVYHAGESFLVPREIPHDAKNVGSTPVTIAVTYVIDKGTPLRVPMP